MSLSPSALLDRARSPGGKKMIRYTLVSVISVCVSLSVLIILIGVFHVEEVWANIVATAVATVPSYELNRKWAWGKKGSSHFWKEVAPFWTLSFIGLAFSTLAVAYAKNHTEHSSHAVKAIVSAIASLGAFGVLWIAKFIIFNELLFKHHPEVLEDEPALDGRTGLPT